jgi:DNA-binding protein YbaB
VDNAALRARADELLGELNRLRTGMQDLQQKLRQVQASVTSDDGLVTATVGPRGQLVRLELDPRLYRRPDSKQLATTITETIQRAAAQAQAQVTAACRPYMPDAEVQAHLDLDFGGMMRRLDHELDGIDRR